MEIVTTLERLLPLGIDISTKMTFIGRLVRRETGVTVKTIGTIPHTEVLHSRVKHGDAGNQFSHHTLEGCTGGIILLAVFVKPLAVVVYGYIT